MPPTVNSIYIIIYIFLSLTIVTSRPMSYMGQMLLTRMERLITFVRFVWAFHSVDMIFVFSYVSLLVWETECRFTHQNWMHCSSVTHLKPVTGFQRILQELFSN